MLTIQNVSFNYNRQPTLTNISAQFPLGKIIGIAGANGSGKSTFVRLLAGILTPNEGTIMLENKKLTRRLCTQFAYSPDIDLFYPHMTGDAVFKHYATTFADFDSAKANEVAIFLHVPTNIKLRKLSKGQRACIKMAATLGRNVPYYFMDEPFAGLDPMVLQRLIRGLLRFIDSETQTIILSTHEIYEVEPVLDALLLIKDQEIIAYETLEEIREELQQNAVAWMTSHYKETKQ